MRVLAATTARAGPRRRPPPAPAFLLFADEPTSRLDLITQEETIDCLMQQLQATSSALVLVTHDRTLANAVSHQHISLDLAGAGLQRAA